MKTKLLFILSLFILFFLAVNPSLALKPDVTISEVEDARLLGGKKILLGQKIEFKIKICVRSDSPVPLDGFHIVITLKKPSGKILYAKQTVNDYIPIGRCENYNFKLNYKADQVGTWKYWVSLYTKDQKYKLDEISGTFEVVGIPKAELEVLDIVGWATASSMIITGLALALTRIIK
ncbi:MAG TPA: hypothetical protein EYP05_06690 [Piscirickettsiaceae bacterium]|nr:hypothetical protein [Piscirickettsiaceae bacterium]